jgi:hypothetical protein
MKLRAPLRVVAFAVALAGGAARAEDAPPAPLPDLAPFLQQVRERLHTDEYLLDQYTFTERHVEKQLDDRGAVKKVLTETYEVYPSAEPGHTYRKLVERDGKPLAASELEKEDRKHDAKLANAEASGEHEARMAALRKKEQTFLDEIFRLYDFRMVGREMLEGRPTIVLSYAAREDFKPTTRGGKVLKSFAGRVWIDEQDRQLVRAEGHLVDTVSFGLGVLARLHKGATASFTRRKVNDEIWLPSEARFAGSARVLLFKGIHLDSMSRYSDYKKFSVGTEVEFKPEEKPAGEK